MVTSVPANPLFVKVAGTALADIDVVDEFMGEFSTATTSATIFQ